MATRRLTRTAELPPERYGMRCAKDEESQKDWRQRNPATQIPSVQWLSNGT